MNKTKIVCTIGPSCSDIETIKDMMRAGMNVARFNMSHGTHESHLQLINLVKQARMELGIPVAIMLDTKGPEIRVRGFREGRVCLRENQEFTLTTEDLLGDEHIVSVTYKKLPNIVKKGTKILLNDGLVELEVLEKSATLIKTKVLSGGELSNNKSICVPGVEIGMQYLSEMDKADLEFGVSQKVDCYSISFVNHASDVEDVRKFLKSCGENNAFIISKIESECGVDNMEEIIKASDGVMVARGDMGVEIDFERLPHIQKIMIKLANSLGKLSITATQMLESMVTNSRPTRAEISDVANAIYDGTSAIMLSGETSAGKHPVLSVATMRKIAEEAESHISYDNQLSVFEQTDDVTAGIGYAACALASSLKIRSILVTTNTGASAKCICRFRPGCQIIALTPDSRVYFKLAMFWGVYPLLDKVYYSTDELMKSARERAKEHGLVKSGERVIQTSSAVTGSVGSNMLVVSVVS